MCRGHVLETAGANTMCNACMSVPFPQEMERGASVQEQLTDLQSKHKDLQNQLAVASRRADALQDEMSHSLREAKQAMEQNVALKVRGRRLR